MGMRIVLAFLWGGKRPFLTVVPAFPRPQLTAMALKVGRCFAEMWAGHGAISHPKHGSRKDGEQAARCRQSPRAAGSGSAEVARLSPACPHFQPDSSCSAGASCRRSALLLPSPPRLACRTGLASVCHPDLTPACQRAALAWNGSAPTALTVQGPQGRNLLLGCLRLSLGWGMFGSMPNPGTGFNLQRIEVCPLWRSEILTALCFPAQGMGASGASRALLLRGASLAPLSLSLPPGQCSMPRMLSAREVPVSRRAAPLPKSLSPLRHPRKLCHPSAIHPEGAEKTSPKSTARCSQRPGG